MTEDQKTEMFIIFTEHFAGLMNEAAAELETSDIKASEAFRKMAAMMRQSPSATIH